MKFTTFLRFMTLQMNARLQPKELNIVLGGSTVLLGITAIVTMILRQSIWLYLVLTAVMLLLMLLCMQTYARLFAKSQDEYLQKRSDDFKRWQAGLLKEEEEIELKEKLVCGIWVFTRLGAVIFLLCALIVFVEMGRRGRGSASMPPPTRPGAP